MVEHSNIRSFAFAACIVALMFCHRVLAASATQLQIATGDNQTATVGTAVPGPVCVIVKDASNAPVSGVVVTWGNITGGGSIAGETQTTNSSGIATLGSWTLGAVSGNNSITATAPGLNSVTFNAVGVAGTTTTAGAVARLAIAAGNNQIAPSGAEVQGPVCAIVTDANNLPIGGVTVTWGNVTGGGSITGETQITGTNGIVTLGSWTLGNPGLNTITASSPGLSNVTFKATAAGAPSQMSIVSGNNQTALVNSPVSTAVCVVVTDANNIPVAGATVTFGIVSGGGSLTGATQTTARNGIATLVAWTTGKRAGINTLIASSPGVPSVTLTATGSNGRFNTQAIKNIQPLTDGNFYDAGQPNPDKVKLGKFLFFDKVLSGNMNVSCATCHAPVAHTGDDLSVSLGVGGHGTGSQRVPGTTIERVPRNATPLFNVGTTQFKRMFHDGRVEVDATQPQGFRSPAGSNLPAGLDNVLAAQALFPVQSVPEMIGPRGSSTVADAAISGHLAGPDGVWDQLAQRLQNIPEYVQLFEIAYSGQITSNGNITYVHAANAIAAFEATVWRADNSPFDKYLRGNKKALTSKQLGGMKLFYGKANCMACHSGVLQTDFDFHNIAMPQIGPGKGDGVDGHDDFGRQRVTNNDADKFKFRTPSLRNVELTAPYGHDGAYATLEAVIQHHLDPVKGLNNYNTKQAVLPSRPDLDQFDFVVQNDPQRRALIAAVVNQKPMKLSKGQISVLVEFLKALTDPKSRDLSSDFPDHVPSGLPLGD
jgi:cytochrome c peroxidase